MFVYGILLLGKTWRTTCAFLFIANLIDSRTSFSAPTPSTHFVPKAFKATTKQSNSHHRRGATGLLFQGLPGLLKFQLQVLSLLFGVVAVENRRNRGQHHNQNRKGRHTVTTFTTVQRISYRTLFFESTLGSRSF